MVSPRLAGGDDTLPAFIFLLNSHDATQDAQAEVLRRVSLRILLANLYLISDLLPQQSRPLNNLS